MKKNLIIALMTLISVSAVNAQQVGETLTFGEVVYPLPETILTASTNPSGCGLSNGTMTAVAGMDSYEVRNVATNVLVGATQTLNTLPAGEYRLTVVYYTCPKDTVFTLVAPNAPVITLISDAPASTICEGSSIGFVAGGAGVGGQYEFRVGTTVVQALSTTTTLTIDTLTVDQTVTVRGLSATGCENTANIDIIVNPVPETILVSTQDPQGCGTSDGQGIAVAGMNSYEWRNLTTDVVVATTETVSTFSAGSYRLTVETIAGCVKDTTFTLVGPNAPVVTVVSDATANTICAAGMDLVPVVNSPIELTASGADEYQFLIGTTVVQALSATATLTIDTLTVNTTVTVRGLSATGCDGFATIDIVVNPLPDNQIPTVNTVAVNANTTTERGECAPAMVIGLQNSQVGYSNRLQLAISPFTVLDTQVGDGSAIEFAPQAPGQNMRILIMSPVGCSRPVTKQ